MYTPGHIMDMKLNFLLALLVGIGSLAGGGNLSAEVEEAHEKGAAIPSLLLPFDEQTVRQVWKLEGVNRSQADDYACMVSFEHVENEDVSFMILQSSPLTGDASIEVLENQMTKYLQNEAKTIPLFEQHLLRDIERNYVINGSIKFSKVDWLKMTAPGLIEMELGVRFFRSWSRFISQKSNERHSDDEFDRWLENASAEELEKHTADQLEKSWLILSKEPSKRALAEDFAHWLQSAAKTYELEDEIFADRFTKWLRYASEAEIEELFRDQFKKWEVFCNPVEWTFEQFDHAVNELLDSTFNINLTCLTFATFINNRLVIIEFDVPNAIFADFLPLFEKMMQDISG